MTRLQKHVLIVLVAGILPISFNTLQAQTESAQSLDQLLLQVKQSRQDSSKINRQREAEFLQQKEQQKQLLKQAQKELHQLEKNSAELEQQFAANEQLIQSKRQQLQQSMGTLKELFGHLTAAAGDFRSNIETSIISAQYPGREQVFDRLIDKMSSATLLPEVSEIEALWYEMLREMTESSKVVRFDAEVIKPDGETRRQSIIRIGTFNLLSEEKYLSYSSQSNSIGELSRQPASNYTNAIQKLEASTSAYTRIGIDPTGPSGGSYLSALVDTPTLLERWHQGGIVGYVITAIGAITALIVLWRLVVLSLMESGVLQLLKAKTLDKQQKLNNALGRVLMVHLDNPEMDAETLEARLTEAILKERPVIERYLPLLKIVAMVAPLLGLLGTVAGMIMTFQAITIYGAGDPKAMASGISSALVTTVLGLLVAIPTVFAHSLLNGKAQNILHILEQQSMGLIARHTESQLSAK
jgi:biopolymer transport protein ExbB